MSKAPARVLLVDDDREEFILTQNILSIIVQDRYALEWVGSYEEGLEAARKGGHDLYLIDYRLQSAKNGLDLLKEAKAAGCQAPMILLTGLWDSAVDQEAMRAGAADYLIKGQFGPEVLERSLRYAIERAKVLRELRESERMYRALVEGTSALLFNADGSGRVVYVNEPAQRLLGVPGERLLGRGWLRHLHRESRRAFLSEAQQQLQAGGAVSLEARCVGSGGREVWLSLSLKAFRGAAGLERVTGVGLDVTERRRLQGLYIQAEKLSAMGLLAAGMAHELNTPLMLILGAAEAALDAKPKDPLVADQLGTIQRAGERCRRLVADMLAFSRKEEGPPAEFDLVECAAAALALAEPQARYRSVRVVRELSGGPLPVRGHKNQLEQVLLNLASNGIDAMPRGGVLTLRARPFDDNGRPAARVEIADNGRGVPPELRPRIFEPFFTTKAPGKGTGLGLSLAQEIVAKHGGRLEYAPAAEKGSVFSVTIPLRIAAEAAGGRR